LIERGAEVAGATSAGGARLSARDWPLAVIAGIAVVVATVALAAGHVAGSGAPALGAAVAGVVVIWCLVERRVGLSLVALGLYLGLLDGYLKLRTGADGVTIFRDLLLWAIAAGALWRASLKGESLRLPPLGIVVLAYAAIVVAELANPSAPELRQALGGVRQHLEFVPLFFLGYAFVRTREAVRVLLLVLVVVAAANGVVSYVQSTMSPGQLAGWGVGYRERINGEGVFAGANRVGYERRNGVVVEHVRPFALGSEIGAGAQVAALAIPALIALLFSSSGALRLGLLLLCVPAVTLAVATAGSRGAMLACFVSAIAFALLAAASRTALRVLVATAVGLVAFVGVMSLLSSDNGAARRAKSVTLSNVVETFTDERGGSVMLIDDYLAQYPFGLGVGTVGPAAYALGPQAPTLNSETEWNLAVIETGIPGLVLLLGMGAALVGLTVTRIRRFRDPSLRIEVAAIAAPLAALCALSFAGPTTVSAPTAPYMWLAAGVLAFWLVRPGPEAAEARASGGVPAG
jgi:hypothetical protein